MDKPKLKKVILYIDESDHRLLKSILALKGLNFSEWARRTIKEFIKQNDTSKK
jgi:hypothetical protein